MLTTLLILCFILCALGTIYSYALYPLLLVCIPARRKARSDLHQQSLPFISLIITAHNEEKTLADKLDNALALQYPAASYEIIVASDCSSDATDDITTRYAEQTAQSEHQAEVRLIRVDERRGKEFAQRSAVQQAHGEIIVFSDVGTRMPETVLPVIANNFIDPQIGALSSEDQFISADGTVAGEGMYVRFEMWLRRQESNRAGLVGLSGSFFAARRALCESLDLYSPSDFSTALACNAAGQIAISVPEMVGIYHDISDPSREYERKVRTMIRGMTGLARHTDRLRLSHGLFAFQLLSHKLMRWLSPWFALATLVSNLLLMHTHLIFILTLGLQLVAYGLAACAHVLPQLRANPILKLLYFFVQVNIAAAQASVQFAAGKRITVWAPSKR